MPIKRMEDGSYDLRGASPEEVEEAIDDYCKRTSPEKNVFLTDEPKGLIGKLRAKVRDIVDDIQLFFY